MIGREYAGDPQSRRRLAALADRRHQVSRMILRVTRHLILAACVSTCVGEAPDTGADEQADTASAGAAAVTDSATQAPSRGEPSVAAADLLDSLTADPASRVLRLRLLEFFRVLFVASESDADPSLQQISGDVLLRVDQFAQAGDTVFLEALMNAAVGWYGRTAEGGEWLNELLWENLVADAELTLTVLSQAPEDVRSQLLEEVYERPVHDGFDFAAVVADLESATVPAGMEPAVARIVAVARDLIPEVNDGDP